MIHPYKIMIVQKILSHDLVQRLQFSEHMLNILQNDLAVIITSDEAHFHLDGHINRQSSLFWAKENFRELHRKSSAESKSYRAVSFVKGLDNQALFFKISVDRRWAMVQKFFIPYLKENEWNIPYVRFQQDGTTTHTARVTMNVIRKTFAGRLITRNGEIPWPPRSPDLSPCDFLCG